MRCPADLVEGAESKIRAAGSLEPGSAFSVGASEPVSRLA